MYQIQINTKIPPLEQNTTLEPFFTEVKIGLKKFRFYIIFIPKTRTHPSPMPMDPPVTIVTFPSYLRVIVFFKREISESLH